MKVFFTNIFIIVFKKTWPFWVGGSILAVLNILFFALTQRPWKITTGFTYWGAWIFQGFGGRPNNWSYFQGEQKMVALEQWFYSNDLSILNFGVILGALISVLLSGQFKIKRIKNFKQAAFALVGGIIMGYGTRISFGCNIGAFFSSVPSLSFSGYVYGFFVVIGAWLGTKILLKYLL